MSILFTADDFGSSSAMNHAILKAYKAGILQAASLMMGQEGTEEAVEMAKRNPELSIGLHLTFVDGKSVLPKHDIPDLVDANQRFPKHPAHTWFKYFFRPHLKPQLLKEIHAQFEAFKSTGLNLSHVDGHHHQHIHPLFLKYVVQLSKQHGARWIRIPKENLTIWIKATPHFSLAKLLHGLTYYGLTAGMQSFLRKKGFFTFKSIFGFLDTRKLSIHYVLKVLQEAPPGNHEIYFHPGASWNDDLNLLLHPEVSNALAFREKLLQNREKAVWDLPADNKV